MARQTVTNTITHGGRTFKITFNKRNYLYGYKEFNKKPRLYPSFSGESLLDNLVNRTTRPAAELGRIVRPAQAAAGYTGRIGWSQRAGCSCPCSPGWIWSDAPAIDFGDGYASKCYDAWVEVTDMPTTRDDAQARATQAARGQALAADPTLPLAALAGTRL
jgi:hypothetical protein